MSDLCHSHECRCARVPQPMGRRPPDPDVQASGGGRCPSKFRDLGVRMRAACGAWWAISPRGIALLRRGAPPGVGWGRVTRQGRLY